MGPALQEEGGSLRIQSQPSVPGIAQSRGAIAMLEHPALADCRASRRRGPPLRKGGKVANVPTEVSELLVDTLESHDGVCGVVL